MNKRSPAPARAAAVAALILAAIVVVVAIGAVLGGGGSDSATSHGGAKAAHHSHKQHVPSTYEVQSGDTLISIAHDTGVTVGEIEALNPQVDPQILIAGEVLKLR
jgi:LysM repeat protein